MDADEEVMEGTKAIAVDLVGEVEDHFIKYHTVSEREQELVRSFAKATQEAIKMIQIGEE